MFKFHFRSWVMTVPRKWQGSTVLTGEPHRMMGAGGVGFFLKKLKDFHDLENYIICDYFFCKIC